MEYCIDLRPDQSERVRYNHTDFPVYLRSGMLSWFPDYAAASHWHDDVEFTVCISGPMDYNVNGEIIHMEEGDGIFVNARQLHFGFSEEKQECEHICVLLHPLRLCSSLRLEQRYLTPLLTDESIPYCHLRRSVDWQKQVLEDIVTMYSYRCAEAAELQCQSLFYKIWWNLYTHLGPSKENRPADNRRLTALKAMLAYIEVNYQNNITLEHIAGAGNVGKTTCCNMFRKYINQTPNLYLINYRLSKGAELLASTDMSIAEICYEVGFGGPSYFAEMFRKSYGCSPSDYRREWSRKDET